LARRDQCATTCRRRDKIGSKRSNCSSRSNRFIDIGFGKLAAAVELVERLEPFDQAPVGPNRKIVIRDLKMWTNF
jgi:hypothetical protein